MESLSGMSLDGVKVHYNSDQLAQLNALAHAQGGDIHVAPITDPSWTPLFVPAAGVVVDVGAPLSHAIIVSRELGIPCVISATGATRRIPNGARIRVDGSTGAVTVLETP